MTTAQRPAKQLAKSRKALRRTIDIADNVVYFNFHPLETQVYLKAFEIEGRANWAIRRLPAKPRRALSSTFSAARAAFHTAGITADWAFHQAYYRLTQPLLNMTKP